MCVKVQYDSPLMKDDYMLSRDELMEFLEYDPSTGIFRWRRSPSKNKAAGLLAGHKNGQGYREIEFRGKSYQAHRLAYIFIYGEWPSGEVDHINGTRDDNRIANLRNATKSQNQHNRKSWSRKTSSTYKGVTFHKATGKWAASIQVNKKRKHLGIFENQELAHVAYRDAALELHGVFARTE
jgi:hypothetical protein